MNFSSSTGQPPGGNWYQAAVVPIADDLSEVIKYLRNQDIAVHVTEEDRQQIVWVAQQQNIEPLREILRRWRLGEISLNQSGVNAGQQTQTLWKKISAITTQFPITFLLLGLSVLGALSTQLQSFLFIYYWFSFVDFLQAGQQQSIVDTIFQLQVWRLVTPMFLHYGIIHIVFNGLMLWVFGGRIETVVGKMHFVLMVLFLSAASNISQYVWEQDPRFGGMSGVNYGLLGYLWIRQLFAPHALLAMPKGMVTFFLAWLVLGVFGIIDFVIEGRIANGAHIGGLLAGALWGAVHGWYLSSQKQ